MENLVKIVSRSITAGILTFMMAGCLSRIATDQKLDVLLIDGQNNHKWEETTPVIKEILEKTGRFDVEVTTCPERLPREPRISNENRQDPVKLAAWKEEVRLWQDSLKAVEQISKEGWLKWHPDFSAYDVIVSNYNGEEWPEEVKADFEAYMKQGGGLVSIHAADNSFRDWEEYNKMTGLGGWGGRNEASGPMLRYRNDAWVQDSTPGRGGMHGKKVSTLVFNLMPDHPIMKGLPEKWMHTTDEIYGMLRGPAENITVLASSYSDKKDNGSGEMEPTLMVIPYHNGRVFHTVYGHNADAMQGLGFQVTLQRGTEWAATGKVTLPLPVIQLSEKEAVLADSFNREDGSHE